MAVKAKFSLSRSTFDAFLTVIGTLLPDPQKLPKNMYEANKVLHALKMPYEHIHACPMGCVLFRKEQENAKYCMKCESSRYTEVEASDA
jgi:hypothetical protein